jgi:hypothetical protein
MFPLTVRRLKSTNPTFPNQLLPNKQNAQPHHSKHPQKIALFNCLIKTNQIK